MGRGEKRKEEGRKRKGEGARFVSVTEGERSRKERKLSEKNAHTNV